MSFWDKIVNGHFMIIPFGLLALYQFINHKFLEGTLYLLVGLGFSLMALLRSGSFVRYKKQLNVISWIIIMAAVILFIALLRQDAYGW